LTFGFQEALLEGSHSLRCILEATTQRCDLFLKNMKLLTKVVVGRCVVLFGFLGAHYSVLLVVFGPYREDSASVCLGRNVG
jgi:alpha-D-ribose 1-methylphosphonate 5-triphosphate synthase subunit PhnL